MTVRDFITELLKHDLNSKFGFIFYDTAVFDIEISTSGVNEEQNELLIFSQRFAKIEK